MGLLKTIVEQLQARSGVTPVTHDGVTAKPSTGAGCTPANPTERKTERLLPPSGADIRPAANEPSIADWKTLDRAYLAHHVQCPQCIAAGKGYGQRCGAGATLWRQYEAAPYPFDRHKRSNSGKTF